MGNGKRDANLPRSGRGPEQISHSQVIMRVPVLSMLLLLCAQSTVTWVQSEGTAVRLCGREFIRAVIYTCGASRWKRRLQEQEVNG
ncbi:relaxin-3-like [Arapaima gigas]